VINKSTLLSRTKDVEIKLHKFQKLSETVKQTVLMGVRTDEYLKFYKQIILLSLSYCSVT
jgi:hypothetical protein